MVVDPFDPQLTGSRLDCSGNSSASSCSSSITANSIDHDDLENHDTKSSPFDAPNLHQHDLPPPVPPRRVSPNPSPNVSPATSPKLPRFAAVKR